MTDFNRKEQEGGAESGSFFKKVKAMGNNAPGAQAVDPAEKRKTLTALLLALGILQTLYMNLAAFFPLEVKDHYTWVQKFQVGLVLA
jgi:hypothetical protein